jgi:uncharacterized coiled-coil DUF342 family protein
VHVEAKPQAHAPQVPLSKEDQLRKLIEEERKHRFDIIHDVKAARNRLSYKVADKAAISQLSEISKSNTKNIGFLRRRKEQLEFRIATEAFTVDAERDLIRKKAEIEADLQKALKSFRLRKKLELIDKDIEELTKRITESEAKIKESDKKLDELYSNLRSMTGEVRKRPERKQQREQPKAKEVSLADIAVMKDKKETDSSSDMDESVLN